MIKTVKTTMYCFNNKLPDHTEYSRGEYLKLNSYLLGDINQLNIKY